MYRSSSSYFWPILTPLPCHTLSHIPGHPKSTSYISDPPIFSRPSTKNQNKRPLYNSLSIIIVRGGFCPGICQGVFCLESFVRGGFCPLPLLSEYICYNRKVNITLNFMFHMYDNTFYKRDVTCS